MRTHALLLPPFPCMPGSSKALSRSFDLDYSQTRAMASMDNSKLNAAVLSSGSCAALHALALQHLRPQMSAGCGMNLVNCATLLHRLAKMGNTDHGGASCIDAVVVHTIKLLAPAATASSAPAPRTL